MPTGVISKIEEWLYCPKRGHVRTKFKVKPPKGDDYLFVEADIPKYLLSHGEIVVGDEIKWDELEVFLTIMGVEHCPFERLNRKHEPQRQ